MDFISSKLLQEQRRPTLWSSDARTNNGYSRQWQVARSRSATRHVSSTYFKHARARFYKFPAMASHMMDVTNDKQVSIKSHALEYFWIIRCKRSRLLIYGYNENSRSVWAWRCVLGTGSTRLHYVVWCYKMEIADCTGWQHSELAVVQMYPEKSNNSVHCRMP